jgi:hypothetical protein
MLVRLALKFRAVTYRVNTRTGTGRRIPIETTDDVEFLVKNERGEPCARWHFLLTDARGVPHTGQLDADGRGRVEQLARGDCTLQVTQEPLA